jgi:hypothetical protein
MRHEQLQHRFVEYIPERLEEGVLYISIEYMTVTHLCCCGCGHEVSTTLSPTDWRLIFDGKTVSLEPSIGSWSLPCPSHYFITRNRVVWAQKWSKAEIETGRRFDAARKLQHRTAESPVETPAMVVPRELPEQDTAKKGRLLSRLRSWWS